MDNRRSIRVVGCWRQGDRKDAANRAHKQICEAANFLRQISGGLWEVKAYGYAMAEDYRDIDTSAPRYGMEGMTATWGMLKDRPDLCPTDGEGNIIPPPFEKPSHWHMFSNQYFRGQCGQHNLRGTVGRTNVGMGCGLSTTCHELGHGPGGAMHSNIRREDGVVYEYGDRTGVMGSAAGISNHVPHQYVFGHFLNDRPITITKNCALNLVPWEVPVRARRDDEHAYAMIDVPAENLPESFNRDGSAYRWYRDAKVFISTRKTRGYPWNFFNPLLGGEPEPRVYIHVLNGLESVRLDSLAVGETSDVLPGVKVTHSNRSEDVSTVEVLFDKDNTEVKPLFDLDQRGVWAPQPGVPPSADVYWNKYTLGQGIDLQQADGKKIMFWYTFTDSGRLDWYVAEIDDEGDGELYTVAKGLNSDRVEVGRVRLLEHDGRVHLDYSTYPHGKGSIELNARGNFTRGTMYYNPDRDGEGFSLRSKDGEIIGWFYTFNGMEREWYHLRGPMHDVSVYRAEGKFIRHNLDLEYLQLLPEKAVFTNIGGGKLNFKWINNDTDIQVIK